MNPTDILEAEIPQVEAEKPVAKAPEKVSPRKAFEAAKNRVIGSSRNIMRSFTETRGESPTIDLTPEQTELEGLADQLGELSAEIEREIPEEVSQIPEPPENIPPDAPEKTLNDTNSIELNPERKQSNTELLDPEIEYQKAIVEVNSEARQLDLFADTQPVVEVKKPTREFGMKDKMRHKVLALEAKRLGVEDQQGFQNLVTYFETHLTQQEGVHQTYKSDLSNEERARIVKQWETKGYHTVYLHPNEQKKGQLELSAYKNVEFNVQRDNAHVIKALLDTGVNPIPLLDALMPNARIDSEFLNSYNLEGQYSKTAKFLELLQTPGIENISPLINGMATVPHEKWELINYETDRKIPLDHLIELAQSGVVPEYGPDFYRKTRNIADVLHKNVSIKDLPQFKDLMDNPGKMQFLTVALASRSIPFQRGFEGLDVFGTLDSLEADGLVEPLTILMRSGVFTGRIFGGKADYNQPIVTQEEINEGLKIYLNEGDVQNILKDPDRVEFAKILMKMNGGHTSSPSNIEELFPRRKELVTLNNIIFPALDSSYDERYGFDQKMSKLNELLAQGEDGASFVSPEFQQFLIDLKARGTELKPGDFFKQTTNMFAQGEYAHLKMEQASVLMQVYKFKDIIDIIDPSLSGQIIEGYREGYTNETLYSLKNFARYTETLKLLKQNDFPINSENFKDPEWIAGVASLPMLRSWVIDAVPPERKKEFVQSVVSIPAVTQKAFEARLYRDKQLEVSDQDIESLQKLGKIFKSDYLPRTKFRDYWKVQEALTVIGEFEGDLSLFFSEGKPNALFAQYLIDQNKPRALAYILTPEMIPLLGENARETLTTWTALSDNLKSFALTEEGFPYLESELVEKYKVLGSFEEFMIRERGVPYLKDVVGVVKNNVDYKDLMSNGIPTKRFALELLRVNDPKLAFSILTDEVIAQFDLREKEVLEIWKSLPTDLRSQVLSESADFPYIEVEVAEKYRVASETITRIRNSPSAEIKRLESELIRQLWQLDNPAQALEEIISIFEKNNLPLVGKTFRVFETIYDNPGATGISILERNLSENTNLSPVLREADAKQRREIIYKDLLSVNINSGNPQLRDYLEVIRDGEGVSAKMETESIEALTDQEKLQLDHFFNKMDMLYASSLFGRTIENRRKKKGIDSNPSTSGKQPQERFEAIKRNFRVRQDQRLTDRLSEMFLRPVGAESIDDVLTQMDQAKRSADTRNRASADGKTNIELHSGDRFKGIDPKVIGKILERGSVAREFLGAAADSDATPYDTDTGLILEGDLANGLENAIKSSPSNSYGDLLLVVKDRGQFGNLNGQYESFASGYLGDRHFGIRTGFASTEIDAMIAKENLAGDYKQMDDLFVTIAQNGEYIPIARNDGTIVFTPAQFDQYRKTFDGVSEYSQAPVAIRTVDNENEATRNSLDELKAKIIEDRVRVVELSDQVKAKISQALLENGVNLRGEFDTSIYGAELVDTGSTGRGSNLPGDYDFDLSLQLDPNDSKRMAEIAVIIKNALNLTEDKSHAEEEYVQIRAIGSQVVEGQNLDIDVGVGKRSDDGMFASSDAITQKLESVKETYGNDTYYDVLANIVLAKQILKEGHAYKKLEDGGMGGIGVENWILLNNGNLVDAFQSFWKASHSDAGEQLSYNEFAEQYKVFDAGLNIKFNRHDNFIQILKPEGYVAMANTIGKYLGYLS